MKKLSGNYLICLQQVKDEFPVIRETTRNDIFSKEISQVTLAAMVLAPNFYCKDCLQVISAMRGIHLNTILTTFLKADFLSWQKSLAYSLRIFVDNFSLLSPQQRVLAAWLKIFNYSLFHGFWQSFVTIGSCNHLMRIISTYVGNTKESEI